MIASIVPLTSRSMPATVAAVRTGKFCSSFGDPASVSPGSFAVTPSAARSMPRPAFCVIEFPEMRFRVLGFGGSSSTATPAPLFPWIEFAPPTTLKSPITVTAGVPALPLSNTSFTRTVLALTPSRPDPLARVVVNRVAVHVDARRRRAVPLQVDALKGVAGVEGGVAQLPFVP